MPDEKQAGEGGNNQGLRHDRDMEGAASWVGHIVRFVVSALVLMLVGYIVPGFSRLTFGTALLAAIVIALIGYVIEAIGGRQVSPYGHGIVGFIVSAIVIYAAQFVVPGLRVTILGALLGAFVIGIVDMFIPTKVR
ncbi:MAG: putative rane protein [Bacillota bacterium]|nr:putative rane protein [Bacillota bacterium]MDK2924524.1 putative rane protein [Bacillota bacterium]